MKTIKISFIDGGFRIFSNVLEFCAAKHHLFIAQKNGKNSVKATALERKTIEEVYRRNYTGRYVVIKLAKSPYESKNNKDYVLYKTNQEKD